MSDLPPPFIEPADSRDAPPPLADSRDAPPPLAASRDVPPQTSTESVSDPRDAQSQAAGLSSVSRDAPLPSTEPVAAPRTVPPSIVLKIPQRNSSASLTSPTDDSS